MYEEFPFVGKPVTTGLSDGTDWIESSHITYDVVPLNGGLSYFPYPQYQVTRNYELDHTLISTQEVENQFDEYGNLTRSYSVLTDETGTYTTEKLNQYENDPLNWILGLKTSGTVTKTAPDQPALTNSVEAEYDADGFLVEEVLEPGHPQSLRRRYTYDGFGNRESVTLLAEGEKPPQLGRESGMPVRKPIEQAQGMQIAIDWPIPVRFHAQLAPEPLHRKRFQLEPYVKLVDQPRLDRSLLPSFDQLPGRQRSQIVPGRGQPQRRLIRYRPHVGEGFSQRVIGHQVQVAQFLAHKHLAARYGDGQYPFIRQQLADYFKEFQRV